VALKAEAYQLHKQLRALLTAHAPELLERRGIGPDSAAALLIAAGDNPERLRSEGSYAALCGSAPTRRRTQLDIHRGIGLSGPPEAITSVFPDTVVQTCVVHVIRNCMRFVSLPGPQEDHQGDEDDLHPHPRSRLPPGPGPGVR
jgi:hypothetical protein